MKAAELYGPVSADVSMVGQRLLDLARAHDALLGDALEHIFETQGKRLRPALVLLCGKPGRYDLQRLVTLAASLEVVHTATLVHDDTIDQALSRRGLETINAVWNPKVAILVGDFLFAQSAELASQLDSVRIMNLLSETVMAMSSGELRQYASRGQAASEEEYLARIRDKTASLFAMCCEGAAIVSDQDEESIRAMREYGLNLGLAFQISDDVLDVVGQDADLGKPAGNDLRQGTVTLPLILFARDLRPESSFLDDVRRGNNLEHWLDQVRGSGTVARALATAEDYASRARDALTAFPRSEAIETLEDLTYQVVTRDR